MKYRKKRKRSKIKSKNKSLNPEKLWWVFPGFKIERFASGLNLPVNIAFIPKNLRKKGGEKPLMYVTELYGGIKAITNNGSVYQYAENLLNYKPSNKFPGTGESGVIGICVEPGTGDLFASMIYKKGKKFFGRVVRTKSMDGLKMNSMDVILDKIPSTNRAHQVQDVSIGFDKKLYVNIGDGGSWKKSPQNVNDLRGKILRLNLDGSIPQDNPYKNNPVFAKGLRNPFGASWRNKNKSLYVSVNGPDVDDALYKIKPKGNYGWPKTMRKNAIFLWHYPQAPTAMDFMQGRQFPEQFKDELFVALFGNAYKKGRDFKGKKIVKLKLDKNDSVKSYDVFVEYIGNGAASPCGLAFGPDGLYFTDLHGEKSTKGNIYRIVLNRKK